MYIFTKYAIIQLHKPITEFTTMTTIIKNSPKDKDQQPHHLMEQIEINHEAEHDLTDGSYDMTEGMSAMYDGYMTAIKRGLIKFVEYDDDRPYYDRQGDLVIEDIRKVKAIVYRSIEAKWDEVNMDGRNTIERDLAAWLMGEQWYLDAGGNEVEAEYLAKLFLFTNYSDKGDRYFASLYTGGDVNVDEQDRLEQEFFEACKGDGELSRVRIRETNDWD